MIAPEVGQLLLPLIPELREAMHKQDQRPGANRHVVHAQTIGKVGKRMLEIDWHVANGALYVTPFLSRSHWSCARRYPFPIIPSIAAPKGAEPNRFCPPSTTNTVPVT